MPGAARMRRAAAARRRGEQTAACLFGAHGAPDAVVQQVQHGLKAPQVGLGEHGGAEGLLALAAAAVEADQGGMEHRGGGRLLLLAPLPLHCGVWEAV